MGCWNVRWSCPHANARGMSKLLDRESAWYAALVAHSLRQDTIEGGHL